MPLKKYSLGLLNLSLLMAWLMMASAAQAVTFEETGAPEELKKWRQWVLYGREKDFCPLTAERNKLCDWPVSLELALNEEGGHFRISYQVFAETFVNLPGGPNQWPREAMIEETGQRLPIVMFNGRQPQVALQPGRWTVSGRFAWASLPETLTIPREAGLVTLRINGQPVDFPRLKGAGLWLKEKAAPSPADLTERELKGDLRVERSRLIKDDMPMRIITHLKLSISGSPREEVIPHVILDGAVPMRIDSQLPARLTEDGALRIQARPGTWEAMVEARLVGPADQLTAPGDEGLADEPWAFQAQNHLRQVEIDGPARIDGNQTNIHQAWKKFPVYEVRPGETMLFKTVRRGDPDPAPDSLTLSRRCWLDTQGGGLTCRDHIQGVLSRQWSLNTQAPFSLGQASVDGVDQLITWQTDSQGRQAPGLQLRKGRLNLQADLRLDGFQGSFPASGWDHDFNSVQTSLVLPAGYKLFYLSGARAQLQNYRHDPVPAAWLERWRTLDLFFVLLITIGVFALYGPKWSVLAFFTMLLSYHEAEAPRLVFLHLLAAAALLKALPQGWLRKTVLAWRFIAALVLVIMAVPFFVHQAKVALYPQLEDIQGESAGYRRGYNFLMGSLNKDHFSQSMSENYDLTYDGAETGPLPVAAPESSTRDFMAEEEQEIRPRARSKMMGAPSQSRLEAPQPSAQALSVTINQAPEAILQNGPGRPQWHWRGLDLIFSGQVVKEQNVRLWLITPPVNSLLNAARVIMMTALSLVLMGFGRFRNIAVPQPKAKPAAPARGAAALALAVSLAVAWPLGAAPAAAQESGPASAGRPPLAGDLYAYPSQKMLDDLAERLLKNKTVPAPACPLLTIAADARELTLTLEVEAAQLTTVPLPQLDEIAFNPRGLKISGQKEPPPLLRDLSGRLYVLVPEGAHIITLSGRLRNVEGLQLNFPAQSQPQQVLADLKGWRLEGLDDRGHLISSSVYLAKESPGQNREEPDDQPAAGGETTGGQPDDHDAMGDDLPAFFLVERTVSLGLEWKMYNQVTRLTAANRQDSVRLPLLPGEKPISGLAVSDGLITLNFTNNAQTISWESTLPVTEALELKAAEGPYTEAWIVDASPIWRVRPSGPPPISQLDNQGFWRPQWRPWAGETLTLAIDRPAPTPGTALVIDNASLDLEVGDKMNHYTLNAAIRSSQGGPYSFKLPEGASVQSLTLQGQRLAYGQDGNTLTVPLSPGAQQLQVKWVAAGGRGLVIRTPEVDLGSLTPGGLVVANLKLNITLPADRWVLGASGPSMGPAVLFWPYLAVLALFAVILGRTNLTPLKTWTWLLLALGLTQLSVFWTLLIVGWLLVLGVREKRPAQNWLAFNMAQLGLLIWSAVALFLLYQGVKAGLMGLPDMQISGNGSTEFQLRWFQDRVEGRLPQGAVYSTPLMVYRGLTLIWALWLAISLIKWLKWGWRALNKGGLWKKNPKPPRLPKMPVPAPATTGAAQTPPQPEKATAPKLKPAPGKPPQEIK